MDDFGAWPDERIESIVTRATQYVPRGNTQLNAQDVIRSALYELRAQTFEHYQRRAQDFAYYPTIEQRFIYPVLGLAGEAGEAADKVKKLFRDNDGVVDAEFEQAITKELGDVLWYLSQLAADLGLSLGNIAKANVTKLADRQRRGVIGGDGDDR